ncbi:MAG: IS4 family transposase [Nanoarchaeota archaeon]|nr:IS4 family transposase [Nanoarchaeota archaeon]
MSKVENTLWIQKQFKDSNLIDKRLRSRAILLACNMMENPPLSIPKQNGNWKNTKAAYRFFDSEKICFSELIKQHTNKTKEMVKKKKKILAIQDTCYISYSHHNSVDGLSDIGGEFGSKGIILHSTMAVDPNKKCPEVLGLLDQCIHRREQKVDKNESYKDYQKRWKESKIWEEASNRSDIDSINLIDVMDREGDVFDIINNCLSLNHDFVIRAKNNRLLQNSDGEKLFEFVKTLNSLGDIELKTRKRPNQIPRKAKLSISSSKVILLGPKKRKKETIKCNVVHVIEKNPPENQNPLEWILLTSLDVNCFEDACEIIKFYNHRWLIEEYHKAIKSGCKVEDKQFKTVERVENYLGIANVVAIRLLQLKDLARNAPKLSAKKIVEPLKVDILLKYQEIDKDDITIYEYYREVAKMGGFLARKSDGEPGWQSIWAGELKLNNMYLGAQLMLGGNTYG